MYTEATKNTIRLKYVLYNKGQKHFELFCAFKLTRDRSEKLF